MATRPANQQSGGSGSTNKPKVKAPAKKPAKTPASTQHQGYTPAPVDPLLASANQQAQAIYAPQVNANASLQASVPTWYADYQTRAAAQAAQQQAYTAPVLAQQNAAVQNLNAPAAGLDPNSAEYAKSEQAGRGLSALAQFSADNTQANLGAGQQYFAGQQANAARYLPEARTVLAQQGGQLASQQAGKAQDLYQTAKTTAVNQDIAYKTLGVNAANTAADNQFQVANAVQTAADKKAARVVSRKNTRDRLAATTTAQQTAADKAAAKQAEKDAAAQTKKTAAVQKAVGKAKVDVTNTITKWNNLVGQETDDKSKPPDAQGNYPGRKLTPQDIKRVLGGQKVDAGLIHTALLVRVGKPLDQAAIDYLHSRDPELRIPREWLKGKPKPKAKPINRPPNAPGSVTGKGQYRPT